MTTTHPNSTKIVNYKRLPPSISVAIAVCFLAALPRGLSADDSANDPQPNAQPTPSREQTPTVPGNAAAPADKPAPSAEDLDRWIADLDSDHYLDRERATQQLIAAGASALDLLLKAANTGPPEPADRALWILRRQGRSRDNDLAIAALEREVLLRNRPSLVQKAESELVQRLVANCQQRLAPLGAEVSLQLDAIDAVPNVAVVLHVRLGDSWQGTRDDLQIVARLKKQNYFRLEGSPVDDATVKLFEERENLALLQLMNTKVSVAAVDSIKTRHPNAIVYLRNQALLGVQAEKHALGVMVVQVPAKTGAAAAGISPGDIITAINGHKLVDFDRMTAHIAQHQPGDKIEVEIIRNNQSLKLPVTLGSWANHGG
jgi:hypothetical protein